MATAIPGATSSIRTFLMIPGEFEPGALTRDTVLTHLPPPAVDITMSAEIIADHQREGGGAPSERQPHHPGRWARLRHRIQGRTLVHGAGESRG